MIFLRIVGWIFVPYVMIGFQWNKIGTTGRALASVWAVISLAGLMTRAVMNSPQSAPAIQPASVQVSAPASPSEPAKQETPATTSESAPTEKPEEKTEGQSNTSGTMTKAEFEQLKNGMSYDEVVAIVGGPGELISEGGSQGDAVHVELYMWEGEGGIGANANIAFVGGKLHTKTQMGLK